jgi:hypothetical protein
MKLDQRFLVPHPRTELWLAQRGKCEHCRHLVRPEGDVTAMRCELTPMEVVVASSPTNPRYARLAERNKNLQGLKAFCIDAREPGTPCGPDAILFQLSLPSAVGATDNSTVGKTDSSQKGT